MQDELGQLERELAAAERKEREWLALAVALSRAKAPAAEVDAAFDRHAEAQARTRQLVRELNGELLS
jgi:hypothetical protein